VVEIPWQAAGTKYFFPLFRALAQTIFWLKPGYFIFIYPDLKVGQLKTSSNFILLNQSERMMQQKNEIALKNIAAQPDIFQKIVSNFCKSNQLFHLIIFSCVKQNQYPILPVARSGRRVFF
jgi:hypothetical protein